MRQVIRRKCLKCSLLFNSQGIHNRVCDHCRIENTVSDQGGKATSPNPPITPASTMATQATHPGHHQPHIPAPEWTRGQATYPSMPHMD